MTEAGEGKREMRRGNRTTLCHRSEGRDSDSEPDSTWKYITIGLDRLLVKVHQTRVFLCYYFRFGSPLDQPILVV